MTTILYFGAPWCAPCKTMKPLYKDLCQEKGIVFTEYDVEADSDLARSMGVMSVPTAIRQDTGDRLTGLQPRAKVEAFLS